MNRKLFTYMLLIAIAGVVLWACQHERFSHSDEPYSQPDLTVSEAQQIFEQQYAESLPYMTKSTGDKPAGMTPGAFTPFWKKARLGANKEMSGADVPIDPEYIFVAVFQEVTADGDTIRRSVDITQKLVVKKWRDTTQGTAFSYIATIVPTPDCYAKHKDIGKVFQYGGDKGDFSGFVVYQTFDGTPVAISRYREGQVSRYEYFPQITEKNIDSVATVMNEVMGDNVSFQSGTPKMFAIGVENTDDPQKLYKTEEVVVVGHRSNPWTIKIYYHPIGIPNPSDFPLYESPIIDPNPGGGGGGAIGGEGSVDSNKKPDRFTLQCNNTETSGKSASGKLYDMLTHCSKNSYINNSIGFSDFKTAITSRNTVEHGTTLQGYVDSEGVVLTPLESAPDSNAFLNLRTSEHTIAMLHSHPVAHATQPSETDILTLAHSLEGCPHMQASFIFVGTDVYCLQVVDPAKAKAFGKATVIDEDGAFSKDCPAGKAWHEAKDRFSKMNGFPKNEQACALLAYVLNKTDAGIVLSRKGVNAATFQAYGVRTNKKGEYYPSICQ